MSSGNPGEILFFKVGKTGNSPIIPHRLSTSITEGIFCYLSTNPKCKEDPVRHKSYTTSGSNTASSGEELAHAIEHLPLRSGGPPPDIPQGISHIIHGRTAAWNDPKIDKIQVFREPVETWEGRERIGPLHIFLHVLEPLSKLLENIFRVVVPAEWAMYDRVRRWLPTSDLTEEISLCFGLWHSRALILNTFTDLHVDLLDVCRGFCAIAPFGDFRDGNVCLPSLGVSIPVCPGKY